MEKDDNQLPNEECVIRSRKETQVATTPTEIQVQKGGQAIFAQSSTPATADKSINSGCKDVVGALWSKKPEQMVDGEEESPEINEVGGFDGLGVPIMNDPKQLLNIKRPDEDDSAGHSHGFSDCENSGDEALNAKRNACEGGPDFTVSDLQSAEKGDENVEHDESPLTKQPSYKMSQMMEGTKQGQLSNAREGKREHMRVDIAVEDTDCTGSIRAEGTRHMPQAAIRNIDSLHFMGTQKQKSKSPEP